MDFYEAWKFLCSHDLFKMQGTNQFSYLLCIDNVCKVNPETMKIDDNKEKNTLVQVWLEAGPWLMPEDVPEDEKEDMPTEGTAQHDIDLDCGANTFEEAIIELARLVRKKYGD